MATQRSGCRPFNWLRQLLSVPRPSSAWARSCSSASGGTRTLSSSFGSNFVSSLAVSASGRHTYLVAQLFHARRASAAGPVAGAAGVVRGSFKVGARDARGSAGRGSSSSGSCAWWRTTAASWCWRRAGCQSGFARSGGGWVRHGRPKTVPWRLGPADPEPPGPVAGAADTANRPVPGDGADRGFRLPDMAVGTPRGVGSSRPGRDDGDNRALLAACAAPRLGA